MELQIFEMSNNIFIRCHEEIENVVYTVCAVCKKVENQLIPLTFDFCRTGTNRQVVVYLDENSAFTKETEDGLVYEKNAYTEVYAFAYRLINDKFGFLI